MPFNSYSIFNNERCQTAEVITTPRRTRGRKCWQKLDSKGTYPLLLYVMPYDCSVCVSILGNRAHSDYKSSPWDPCSPCHPCLVLFPMRPWQTRRSQRRTPPPAHLCSSAFQHQPQILGDVSEPRKQSHRSVHAECVRLHKLRSEMLLIWAASTT